jgi:hypothetical protein
LKRDATGEIVGWIIAADIADAKNRAHGAGDHQLAELLYRMEGPIEHTLPAIHDLPIPGHRFTMLRD